MSDALFEEDPFFAELAKEVEDRRAAFEANPLNVKFTQYLLPHGERQDVWIERTAEIAAMAKELQAKGVSLEIEMLGDFRTISMTAERETPEGEIDVMAAEIVQNGPAVVDAVDKLIRTAHSKL